jgi:PAS domain S-box-containing protein
MSRQDRILIVEDENIVAVDIQDRLEHLGYKVIGHAVSGEDAIRLAHEAKPDIVLMDIMLKGKMDGIEAAESIRRDPDIPVVFLTAYADQKTLQRAKITEPYGYILKPFEEREIHSTIEMAIYRHRIGKKLRESQLWLSAVLRSVAEAVITTDMHGMVTFLNPMAESLAGCLQDEAAGNPLPGVLKLLDEENRAEVDAVHSSSAGDTVLKIRGYAVSPATGRETPVSISSTYIKDEHDSAAGVVIVLQDITEQKKAEQEISESELKFRSVIQTAGDAIIMADSKGRVVSWNNGAENIFGYTPEEMLGENVVKLMPERLRHLHEAGMERVSQHDKPNIQGKTLELTGRRKDGTEFPIELSVTTWKAKGEVFASGIIRDITERKRAEEELESTLSELNIIFENATVGIAFILSGEIVRVNRRLEEIFGYSREELSGRSTELLFPNDEAFRELQTQWQKVLGKGETFMSESVLNRKDGSKFWCGLLGRRIDPADRRKGAIWIFEDITEQHKAREQLRAARDTAEQASRAKSEFLANMSHEIRTPMNGILGMVELMHETGLGQEQQEYVSIIKQSADNLLTLLNDILDFSKIEAGRLDLDSVQFNLRSSLDSTIKTLSAHARRKGLDLQFDIDENIPAQLIGDPGRLRQVIVNLLNNAIKFTNEGMIRVKVKLADEKQEDLKNDIVLRFIVTDTGIGIPREKHEHVFESFTQGDGSTTRKYGGTGLGLTISKQLVQLMGGDIWVESEPDKGSSFYFTARFKGADVPAGQGQADERPGYKGIHVLLVGDNEAGIDAIARVLQSWGFNTLTAYNQADALETAHDAPAPFHLVLLDCNMRDVTRHFIGQLKNSLRTGKASFVALLPSDARNEYEVSEMDALLFQPFITSDLQGAVIKALEKQNVEKENAVNIRRLEEDDRLRVLLAEDNPVNQKLVERMLSKEGVHINIVSNGRDAVERLRDGRYHAVLMDVQMPEVDGIEATRLIRNGAAGEENAGIPIIALTAHAMGGDRERFIAAGMDGYVSKPFKSFDIMSTLLGVLGRPSADGGGEKDEPETASPGDGNGQKILDIQGALALLDGDRDLLYEIWQDFVDEGQGWLELIFQAIDKGDFETLERVAHSMKSSSGSVGANVLRGIAFKLEVAGKKQKRDDFMILFEQMKSGFDAVKNAIRKQLSNNQEKSV